MANIKPLAGALVVGTVLGGLTTATFNNQSFDTQAAPYYVRQLENGRVAVSLVTRIGDCFSEREFVVAADGGSSELNGHELQDPQGEELARAAAEVMKYAQAISVSFGGTTRAVKFIADGRTAVVVAVPFDGGVNTGEVIYDVDGGAPRIGGEIVTPPLNLMSAGSGIQKARGAAKQAVTSLTPKLVEPLPTLDPGRPLEPRR